MNKLTLIGTSIGNYEDISIRAMQNLALADIVLAEDTRVFGKLKSLMLERNPEVKFNQTQKVVSYREQNHSVQIKNVIDYLCANLNIVLISDAGMPTISDPGFNLVDDLLKNGFEIDVIPGPTAVESALAVSGLPTDKFIYLGFLPRKPPKIKKLLDQAVTLNMTIVIYESPFRVRKILELLQLNYSNVRIAACNDLTKKFQKVYRGSISEVLQNLPSKLKGEWTLVLRIDVSSKEE